MPISPRGSGNNARPWKPTTIRKVGVIGAGQMGRGIAQVAAAAGSDVGALRREQGARRGGQGPDRSAILAKQVEKGKLPAEAREALLARVALAERRGRARRG